MFSINCSNASWWLRRVWPPRCAAPRATRSKLCWALVAFAAAVLAVGGTAEAWVIYKIARRRNWARFVALGAVAVKTLLAINAPMSELRGRWYDFRGTKLAVTYHPAFLLRDPRQKKETWKDLQMVMKDLGLETPAKPQE